jgi:hypothetical protein
MPPAKKTPAKKAAARKAPAKKTTPRKRAARKAVAEAQPGPLPRVLHGFDRKARTWTETSTVGTLLAVLSWGATWEHAAARAKIHPAQPRRWISRGETALVPTPDTILDLDDLDTPDTPDDLFACAVLALEAIDRRASPVLDALETISRDSKTEWRAAALALRVLPEAKPYRETTKTELTGEDGGPVVVDHGPSTAQAILDLAGRIAADLTDKEDPS